MATKAEPTAESKPSADGKGKSDEKSFDSMKHFLTKLYESLKTKGNVTGDDFIAAIRHARSSSGGTAKAANSSSSASGSGSSGADPKKDEKDKEKVSPPPPASHEVHIHMSGETPKAAAEEKVPTHDSVHYRAGSGDHVCSKCSHYSDGNCSVLKGPVSAGSVCDGFSAVKAMTEPDELLEEQNRQFDEEAIAVLKQMGFYDGISDYPSLTLPEGPVPMASPSQMKYEKADSRVMYRKATVVGKTCEDCVHFCECTSGSGTCCIVEGAINEDFTCSLFLDEDMGERDEAVSLSESSRELAEFAFVASPTRLFNEVLEFGEGQTPDWIPFLPKPGSYSHPKYGAVVVTPERNRNFIAQFDKKVYQEHIPIDLEHQTKVSGAAGYIRQLRQNPDQSVDGRIEWTPRGATALAEKRFHYFSPEWWDKWADPITSVVHEDVIVGGALTTKPFFKEGALRQLPLVASEGGLSIVQDEVDVKTFDEPGDIHIVFQRFSYTGDPTLETRQEVEPMSVPNNGNPPAPATVVTPPVPLAFAEEIARRDQEIAALRQMSETQTAQISQATETIAAMRIADRTRAFAEEVTGRSAANGIRWFGETEGHVKVLSTLADTFGEDSDEIKNYVAQNRAAGAAVKQAVLTPELGRPGTYGEAGGVMDEVRAEAKKFTEADPKLTYAEAEAEVFSHNPALYSKYLDGMRRVAREG